MSAVKPVTVDTVYEAVKSFIETNNILKQVIEDELCNEFETIINIKDTPSNMVLLFINGFDLASNRISTVTKEQLVKIINNFIA